MPAFWRTNLPEDTWVCSCCPSWCGLCVVEGLPWKTSAGLDVLPSPSVLLVRRARANGHLVLVASAWGGDGRVGGAWWAGWGRASLSKQNLLVFLFLLVLIFEKWLKKKKKKGTYLCEIKLRSVTVDGCRASSSLLSLHLACLCWPLSPPPLPVPAFSFPGHLIDVLWYQRSTSLSSPFVCWCCCGRAAQRAVSRCPKPPCSSSLLLLSCSDPPRSRP